MESLCSEETQKRTFFNDKRQKYELLGITLLVAFHFFGLVGMNWSFLENLFVEFSPFSSFLALTPFNLILTCGILLYFHRDWNRYFIMFIVSCFLVGFFIEVAGVQTGIVFGEYSYGKTLGWKVFDVPLTIGLNWLVLTYSTGILLFKLKLPKWQKAILLGVVMTSIDYFIEPVAIKLDFWSWAQEEIPLQNYLAWFIVSALLGYLFFWLDFDKRNPLAKWVIICQLLFFLGQNVFLS